MHSMKKMKTMRIQNPDSVAQGKSIINREISLFIIFSLLLIARF